jgi:phage baseplate assembly protein W
MTDVAYPFAIDPRGRTALTQANDHIRDMIEQVLFTAPGERVNRPTFGCGIMQLLFAPNDAALAAAVNVTVQSSLQLWLGDLIEVAALEVSAEDSILTVDLTYVVRQTQQRLTTRFTRGA